MELEEFKAYTVGTTFLFEYIDNTFEVLVKISNEKEGCLLVVSQCLTNAKGFKYDLTGDFEGEGLAEGLVRAPDHLQRWL